MKIYCNLHQYTVILLELFILFKTPKLFSVNILQRNAEKHLFSSFSVNSFAGISFYSYEKKPPSSETAPW